MLEMTSVFDSVLLFNNEKPPTINLDLNSQEQKQKHFRHYKKRELNTDARAVEKSGPITKLIKWKKSSFPSLRTQNSAERGHDKQQKSVTASATALEAHKSKEYNVLVAIFILMACSWMNLVSSDLNACFSVANYMIRIGHDFPQTLRWNLTCIIS